MDLVAGVKRVVAGMSHMDKAGNPKIVKSCSLPLTGADVVDAIVSELGSFALDRDRSLLIVNQLADGVDMDLVRRATGIAVDADPEEHTSELQSLMRISYAVFCLKKKKSIHQS